MLRESNPWHLVWKHEGGFLGAMPSPSYSYSFTTVSVYRWWSFELHFQQSWDKKFLKEGWTLKPAVVNKAWGMKTIKELSWLRKFVIVMSSSWLASNIVTSSRQPPNQSWFVYFSSSVQPLLSNFCRNPNKARTLKHFLVMVLFHLIKRFRVKPPFPLFPECTSCRIFLRRHYLSLAS